jgi:hypothetical protein
MQPIEANLALPLIKESVDANGRILMDVAIAAEMNLIGDPALAAADAARDAGNSPNTVMAAAVAIIGPGRAARAMDCARHLIDHFRKAGLVDVQDMSRISPFDADAAKVFLAGPDDKDPRAAAMLAAIRARGGRSAFLTALESLGAPVSRDAVLAAISVTLAWGPLMRKRITRLSAETLPWYLRLYGVMLGASIPAAMHQHGSLCGVSRDARFGHWTTGDFVSLALTGRKPAPADALTLQMLIGLLISNGPGAITAQGAKGAVAADGPQTPARVQINKAMMGFLTHSGYSHGGNGYEGIAFLIDQFAGKGLTDPTDPHHGIDLAAMARQFADAFVADKAATKGTTTEPRALPGIHHPIFRDKPVNFDPRERFIAAFMAERGRYNIFHAYYRELVQALYNAGATRTVFCVNVDAVIAALLLAVLWNDHRTGTLAKADLESAAFNVFLYSRMIGAAAEIDDHMNRGRNMDTRTPQDKCVFVV